MEAVKNKTTALAVQLGSSPGGSFFRPCCFDRSLASEKSEKYSLTLSLSVFVAARCVDLTNQPFFACNCVDDPGAVDTSRKQ